MAIHAFERIEEELKTLQSSSEELKQVGRLKYYGLKLFKLYIDEMLPTSTDTTHDDLYAFGGKFNAFFNRAKKIIGLTLSQSYREI